MAERSSPEDTEIRRCKVSIPLAPTFFRSTRSVSQSDLILTETRLIYELGGKRHEILLEDLIGIQVLQSPPPNTDTDCRIEINSYPLVGTRKASRKFVETVVQFDSASSFQDNLSTAVEWKKAINLQCRRAVRKIFHYDVQDSAVDDDEASLVPRHFLVFINPVGGPGRGVNDFRQHVQPLFDLAEINYNIIVTERQGHAQDIMKDYDVTQIDGIVLSSGDGLLYEVINGLLEREDWESAVKTPIGMLPTGSGNALCVSTLYEANEEYNLTNAAFQIIRGGIIPMDIASVQVADDTKRYMTLLCNWGMVADVDIESEKWRSIGETRFLLGGLISIIKKKTYRGRLHYLPVDASASDDRAASEIGPASPPTLGTRATKENSEAVATATEMESRHITIQVTAEGRQEAASSHPEEDSRTGVEGVEDSSAAGTMDDQQVASNGSRERELTLPIEIDSTETLKQPDGSSPSAHLYASSYTHAVSDSRISPALPSLQTTTSEARNGEQVADSESPSKSRTFVQGPKTPLLPKSVTDPVPGDWVTLDAEFLIASAVMIPHMGNGFIADPNFSIGTGRFRILYVCSDMGRFELLSLLSGADSGNHLEMDKVKLVDARAYRIEPITAPGMLTLDGEVVPYGPMQGQVHKHLARVMCRKRRSTHSQTI